MMHISLWRYFPIHFIFCFILLAKIIQVAVGTDLCDLNVTINLQRNAENMGYHRDIITEISYDRLKEVSNVSFLVVEHFPADMYVDFYELRHLSDFGGPEVLLLNKVDVESPAYNSVPFDTYVYMSTRDLSVKSILPVHLRYQRAHNCSDKGYFTKVRLGLPTIYIRFDDIDLSHCGKAVSAPCGVNRKSCSWISTTVTTDTPELSFLVPVGCTEDKTMVTISTVVIITVGTAIISHVLLNKTLSSHKKIQ